MIAKHMPFEGRFWMDFGTILESKIHQKFIKKQTSILDSW